MTSGSTFWQRLSGMLRRHDGEAGSSDGVGALGRTPTNRELRDNYQRVNDLVDAMQQHFQRQDERAEHLTQAVERVGGVLEQIASLQAEQRDSLQAVARVAESSSGAIAELNQTALKLPAAFQSQADAVRALGQQIEIAQEADHRVAHALLELGQSVDTLNTSSKTQVAALQHLTERENEQRRTLETLVTQQGKRLVLVLAILLVLALLIAAGAITFLLLSGGR